MCKGIGRLVNNGRFIQYCILIKHYGRKSNEKKQENATWQKKTKGRKSQTKTFVEKHRRTFAKKANTVNILMVRLLIGSCRGQILRYLQSAMSVPDLKVY